MPVEEIPVLPEKRTTLIPEGWVVPEVAVVSVTRDAEYPLVIHHQVTICINQQQSS